VSKYLYGTPDKRPGDVGEKCFAAVLEEAK
jgi:hypothetical protein